ncbi:MAG: hypothetical protein N4A71_00810 [Carboxylicivirga sp.]|jgi:site-specific recombinase XerD|nr:hypothetical protein [Carboxylicivirga sp.]
MAVAKLCGVAKNLTVHMIRYTFATSIVLSNGVIIEAVAKIIEHNLLITTEIYEWLVECKIDEICFILIELDYLTGV